MRASMLLYMVMSASVVYAGGFNMENMDSMGIWVALFALGIIGIVILYISSKQVSKTEEVYRHIIDKQQEIEHKQNYPSFFPGDGAQRPHR